MNNFTKNNECGIITLFESYKLDDKHVGAIGVNKILLSRHNLNKNISFNINGYIKIWLILVKVANVEYYISLDTINAVWEFNNLNEISYYLPLKYDYLTHQYTNYHDVLIKSIDQVEIADNIPANKLNHN